MQQDFAQIVGLRALGWLAGDDELFGAFLGASGSDATQVRAQAQDPSLQCAVLDFVLQRDDWVLACADAVQLRAEDLVCARAVLGGGDQMHWT